MTINQAIRILDPETTAEELAAIEYYGGLHGLQGERARCVQHLEGGGQFQRHAPSGSHQRAYGQAGV